jgi:GPH family glycoside/pentoside/hexuronide:cation symporter
MTAGIIVALIFPMLILPALGVNKDLWILVMSIFSVLALPCILLEYYFTKERITLEKQSKADEMPAETAQPLSKQLKAVFTNRYWLMAIAFIFVYQIGTQIKNVSLVYYCNYVLGTYNDGITQTMVSAIGGIPMGIGIFAVWPIAKRIGKRNTLMYGMIFYALGGLINLIFPQDMVLVLIGQFIKNIGGLPVSYIFMALLADCLDHVEWKAGFRCDGLSMSIYTIILTLTVGIANGVFNMGLAATSYVPPSLVDGVTIAAAQSDATQNVITFMFVGLEIATAVIMFVLFLFEGVEKNLKLEQDEIAARKRI